MSEPWRVVVMTDLRSAVRVPRADRADDHWCDEYEVHAYVVLPARDIVRAAIDPDDRIIFADREVHPDLVDPIVDAWSGAGAT